MAGDRLHRILAELSAGGADLWSSARLCRGCVKITGVDGAGIMLMSGDIPRGSLCTTNEVSNLIEELQYTLGEGPCVDAYQHDMVVAEPDLADAATRRWVAFTPPALEAGVRAVFGFPMRSGTVRLGALNLYRDRSGPLTDGQHADAVVHNAAGIVSVQQGISVTEALIRLLAYAFSHDRLLADVAEDVVARRLRLE
jgi:hypothetical protein